MLDTFQLLMAQVRKDGGGAEDNVEQWMDREALLRRAALDFETARKLADLADKECHMNQQQKKRKEREEKQRRDHKADIRKRYKAKMVETMTPEQLEARRVGENRKRGVRAAAARLRNNPALAERRARLSQQLREQQA